MVILPFSYNWNNKLDCTAFTTIRIFNTEKHIEGIRVNAVLKGQSKGFGTIMSVKPFYLAQLNTFISYLDTGYSVEECRNIILKMYPKVDFAKQQLALLLIVKDKL
ncbi:MAG TPA: hypothetical protein PKE30_16780 [Niabella sp.]|nr:hypothetical protein [Niabella sp.]